MMKSPRVTALIATIVAALAAVWLLCTLHLSVTVPDREWPPRHDGEIAMAEDDNFFEVKHEAPAPVHEEAAPVKARENASRKSDPAPASGHDTYDRGKAGDAPSTVTSERKSPVKEQKKEKPQRTGPSKEELEKQKAEEEARRRASAATSSAFSRASGKNNTANKGREEGNSGSVNGKSESVNGTGTGTVGGGWRIPAYAKVPATVTGTIKLKVNIDRSGKVKSVEFEGGTPPAATDSRLRRAVEAEVRSRRFTRSDDNAPDRATAYITYRFK